MQDKGKLEANVAREKNLSKYTCIWRWAVAPQGYPQ